MSFEQWLTGTRQSLQATRSQWEKAYQEKKLTEEQYLQLYSKAYDSPENYAKKYPTDVVLTEEQAEDRKQAFLEQEAEPGDVFRQFLQQDPRYGQLSGLGRTAMKRQYQPQLQSFLAQSAPSAIGDPATFRGYLQGGQQALNPQQLMSRLGQIAGYFGVDPKERTEEQEYYVDRYGENPNAFAAYLQPFLARTNPLFRESAGNVAQGVYDRFMGATPDLPFLQEMARRGGFFGGR